MQRKGHTQTDAGTGGVHARGALGAKENGGVPISPDFDVPGEQARDDPASLHALKLRVGNELRMDEHVAQIRARAPLHGLFKSLDDRFRGGVAVGMHGDLKAEAVVLDDDFVDLFLRPQQRTLVAGAGVVVFKQRSGEALNGAVGEVFDPADLHVVVADAPHAEGDELVHLGRQKLQIGSGVEPAFAGKLHVRPEEHFGFAVDPEPAILKRGKAFLIVFGDGADEAFAHLSFRGNGQAARGFDDGVFQQQAGGQAVPVKDDLAAGDLRIGGETKTFEADGIDVPHMYRNMDNHHGPIGADGIKIVAVHVAVVGNARVVIPVADHPFVIACGGLVAQGLLHGGDGTERSAAVHLIEAAAERGHMAVGVDKAGIEGPAAEIHDVVFARFGVSEDLFTASDAFDAPVRDADGFGFGSLFGHGDDISPDIDGLFAYQHELAPLMVVRRMGAFGTQCEKNPEKNTLPNCPF